VSRDAIVLVAMLVLWLCLAPIVGDMFH